MTSNKQWALITGATSGIGYGLGKLKEMVNRGDGKILNLSSVASKVPNPYKSVYHVVPCGLLQKFFLLIYCCFYPCKACISF